MTFTQSSSSSSSTQHSILDYLCSNTYSHDLLHFINSILKQNEPASYVVCKDPHWRKAMEDKINALKANDTWTL